MPVRLLILLSIVASVGPASNVAAAEPLNRRIDAMIAASLAEKSLEPAGPCTDAEFLRRATLDVTGTIPTAEDVVAFLEDETPDKHRKLIDRLLAGDAYAEHLAETDFLDPSRARSLVASVRKGETDLSGIAPAMALTIGRILGGIDAEVRPHWSR